MLFDSSELHSPKISLKKSSRLLVASRKCLSFLVHTICTSRFLRARSSAAPWHLMLQTDSKDRYGRTPLLWAADSGHEAVVKLLLETGKAEADLKDEFGRTPLWWASEKGDEAAVKLLLGTGKVKADSKGPGNHTPLSWAIVNL
jgi:hypothetical protein